MKLLTVDLDLPAEDHAKLVHGHGMPDDALLATIDADQVRYLPDPGLPPLTDAAVTGKVTGRTVQLAIGQAMYLHILQFGYFLQVFLQVFGILLQAFAGCILGDERHLQDVYIRGLPLLDHEAIDFAG